MLYKVVCFLTVGAPHTRIEKYHMLIIVFVLVAIYLKINLYDTHPGEHLNKFVIVPQYKSCALRNTNKISTGETKSFTCKKYARGTYLKIDIPYKKTFLTLCEVFVFGTGTVALNISIASNTRLTYTD